MTGNTENRGSAGSKWVKNFPPPTENLSAGITSPSLLTEWQEPLNHWLPTELSKGIGLPYRLLLGSTDTLSAQQLSECLGDINRQIAVAQFDPKQWGPSLVDGFSVLSPPGTSLGPPARAQSLVDNLKRYPSVNLKPPTSDIPSLLRYFLKVSPYGFGPLTTFQAQQIRTRSPHVLEIAGGNGFNAALLRSVDPSGTVTTFDDFSYDAKAWVLEYTRAGESLGGPAASTDFSALREWIYSDPDRFLSAWLQSPHARNAKGFRALLCAISPKYDQGCSVGGSDKLREPGYHAHDLLIAYPPTLDALNARGLLYQSVRSLSPSAKHVHVMPGNLESGESHPMGLLTQMYSLGWAAETVIPSSLPGVAGVTDVVTFVKIQTPGRDKDCFTEGT